MKSFLKYLFIIIVIASAAYYFLASNNDQVEPPIPKQQERQVNRLAIKKLEEPLFRGSFEQKVEYQEENVRPISDSRWIVRKTFPDIEFEAIDGCPKNSTQTSIVDDDESDYDFSCATDNEIYEGMNFWIEQTYLNGSIIEYKTLTGTVEPLSIVFSSPEEIGDIYLWIDGGIVFGIKFKNNLVDSFFGHPDEVDKFYERLEGVEAGVYYPQVKVLAQGKKKLESLLFELCRFSNHHKTCEAYQAFVDFKYVPMAL